MTTPAHDLVRCPSCRIRVASLHNHDCNAAHVALIGFIRPEIFEDDPTPNVEKFDTRQLTYPDQEVIYARAA